jgi:hypothetical protein
MTLAELHALHVARIGTKAARPCTLCGAPLRQVARPADTFGPVDTLGSPNGPDPDMVPLFAPEANWLGSVSPYDHLARLGALLGEATAGKRTETTWLYDRSIREYVALKVRLDVGMSFHYHRLPSDWDAARFAASYVPGPQPRSAELPYHCGRPALLRPSGWTCRGCRVALTEGMAELVPA